MAEYGYERGGLHYTLKSIEADGRFSVQYTCLACNETFPGESNCVSEPEAVGRTKARLFSDHYVPIHVLVKRAVEKREK
jgi:hypothetical protein